MQHWYVAQLKAGGERVAMQGLGEQGFETFSPSMAVTRTNRGRVVDRSEPVFPNYLFVRSAPDAHRWRAVNYTRGVARLLGNSEPCPVDEAVVDDLKRREAAGLLRHPYRRPIRAGDRVVFKVGSLQGLQGLCQWTRRERISVLLQILGASTTVLSPRDWLKLAVA